MPGLRGAAPRRMDAVRITESQRTKKALEMIEQASSDAQSTDPKRDWESSQDAIYTIYELVHSIRSPECRCNHPDWVEQIDDAIRAERG